MAKKTVAHPLVETPVKAGVKHVFGVAGDSLNGITDTIRVTKEVEWLPMRHEEVGAFAAGAEAHLTGSLAVCAGSCGPGNPPDQRGVFRKTLRLCEMPRAFNARRI
jgi:pyruvate dehydrogenase (quinone)